MTDEAAVNETFDAIGEVDVLINNAGIAESAPLAKTTLRSWLEHFDVNVTAPSSARSSPLSGSGRGREQGSGTCSSAASQ